jgi:carbonic anhydrase
MAAALPCAAIAADPVPAPARPAAHWGYDGATGPNRWAKLEKDFHTCALGHTQSPININTHKTGASNLGPITFSYQPTALHVLDNGHTIQVNVDAGSSIQIGGQTYALKQFHFHHPSEEKIDGKDYPLVAHMVHATADGKLAVVAVLFQQGSENPLVQKIWARLPAETGKEVTLGNISFNPADLLPVNHHYFNFTGSLTTPPCSEGVNWFVLITPVQASRVQVARFGAIYPHNARPSQKLYGRTVQTGG